MNLTAVIHAILSSDTELASMLSTYRGEPAIFTVQPAPGDADLPYIITAGDIAQTPFDTKLTRGRMVTRDVRCYTTANGSAVTVDAIAERVREILHRVAVVANDQRWIVVDCSGPIAADEQDAYCRIVTVKITLEEV